MKNTIAYPKVVHIPSRVVLSDNSAKKIGLSSVDEIKKGALITLPCYPDGTQNYRILSVKGTQIKVVAMHSIEQSVFNLSDKKICFAPGSFGQPYQNSELDAKMTKIYNLFPHNIKKAIVPQNIEQSLYDFSCNMKRGSVNIGKRYVYVLDVSDVMAYCGHNVTMYFGRYFTSQEFNEMFDIKDSTQEQIWLRTADADDGVYTRNGYGNFGCVNGRNVSFRFGVRPAFVIDLAKLMT